MSDQIKRIRRSKHDAENKYFLMARETAQEKTLSYEAVGMLAYLLSKPDDWIVQPKDLQREGCGRDKVYRILGELKDAHYVEREKRFNDKHQIEWGDYVVYEIPHTEIPDTENQDMDYTKKPFTEIPDTENQHITEYREVQDTEKKQNTDKAGAAQVSHSDNDATASYIKAWLEGQSTQPAINQYGNKTNRNIAKQLANAGIPKEKVTAFTKHLAAQPYWKGKLVPITTVGNDIAAWLSSAAAPAPINPAHVKIEPVADHDAPDRELIETTIADLAKRFSVKDEVQRVPTNIEAA